MTTHLPRCAAGDASWDWLLPVVKTAGQLGEWWPPTDSLAADDGASWVATCALRAEPESVKSARDLTATVLRGWDMTELVDDVKVAGSELVTNALRHGARRSALGGDRPIRFGLLCPGARVLCAVADPSDEIPVLKEPDYLAETGRGLHVIASLSDAWGWAPYDRSGKVVWATFSARH